jgi:hypothetical protein
MDYEAVAPVLRSVALSAAAREPLDPLSVANELGRELEHVLDQLHQLEATGLMLPGEDQNASTPILMHAGSQYLAAEGRFSHEQLRFLPVVIDDLHTRGALLAAGTRLVDEFRSALLRREAVTHARDLVHAAFVPAVNEMLAINLFAASVALMCRLSSGEAAGCLAEEILAVEVLELASSQLELGVKRGVLTPDELMHAREELRSIFELFEDDDVLDLFDMQEPSDAVVAQHGTVHQQMGKVDQRVESWFRPFARVTATGYYADRPPS